jgi:hypothetical protein
MAHMVLDKAMILIAHRGNIHGRKEERENTKTYALEALERGYNVELDVWFTGKLWLGHRKPKEQIELEFLQRPGIWCHAKNIKTLQYLLGEKLHCFYHDSDLATLTSRGYVWIHSGHVYEGTICVLPEMITASDAVKYCTGICSDNIEKYRNI